jgi:hypothetical protein
MDEVYESSSAGQTSAGRAPGWRERLRTIRKHSRQAWRRVHWSSGDTLALVIAIIISGVILWIMLQP